jgi:hypothetical protein
MESSRLGRLALTALLALYGFKLMAHPDLGSLMDSVDLPIHETGHLVFAAFGEFMQFLGGTLFQLIMPTAFAVYFLKRGDRHAASVVTWWIAQNCWNISVYVRDARAQELPLVGGGEHDWAYLLGRMHALASDQRIGQTIWGAGVLLFVVSIVGGLVTVLGRDASTLEAAAAES